MRHRRRHLVAEGARVVLGATSDRVHDRAAELGDAAVGVIADLTAEGSAESLVDAAVQRWGQLDIGEQRRDDIGFVGLGRRRRRGRVVTAQWDAAIAKPDHHVPDVSRRRCRCFTAAGYGRIVSVGSTTGTVNAMPGSRPTPPPRPGWWGLSRALALEVVGDGVTVNVVAPGYIATGSQLPFEAAAAAAGPIGRSGTPTDRRVCAVPRARVGVVCHRRGAGRRRRARPAETWPRPWGLTRPR